MDIKLHIANKIGELSIPQMEWSIRFTDKEAGLAAIYKFCEDGLLPTEDGSRFLKALERSNLSATGPRHDRDLSATGNDVLFLRGRARVDELALKFHSDDTWITI